MIGIKFLDGDIIFNEKVEGIEEFIQRWINSLKTYSNECYYNENLGLDINIIDGVDNAKFKLEHIKTKTLLWYGEELQELYYDILSQKKRNIKAIFYFKHKIYGNFKEELNL